MAKHTPYWWRVIAEAKRRKKAGRKPFLVEHQRKAAKWTTCACGKQDPRIPREDDGTPLDGDLYWLGIDFAAEVNVGNPKGAEETLGRIEKRAAEVLAKAIK